MDEMRAEAPNQPFTGRIGVGDNTKPSINDMDMDPTMGADDRAQKEYGVNDLYNLTNGMGPPKFHLEPGLKAVSSDFPYPETLSTTKQPVPSFWTYSSAYPGLTDRGKIATSLDQVLPNKRITEQDAIEWNRVGSKKGWMFCGKPQQGYGYSGENVPTHTDDGFLDLIGKNKYHALPRSAEKQGIATRELPAIDIVNNARGIGVTGPNSGNGGMAGGYHAVQPDRLTALPVPMEKFCWTGSRLQGTARTDRGAGGRRSGYDSVYPMQPNIPIRRSFGITNPVAVLR